MKINLLAVTILIQLAAFSAFAQTTEFAYQGSLKDGTVAANGNYDFEFRQYDAASGGNQPRLARRYKNENQNTF